MHTEHDTGSPRARRAIGAGVLVAAASLAVAASLRSIRADTVGSGTTHNEVGAMKTGEGIISRPSSQSVPVTLDRLEAVLRAKGVTVFARVDHSGEATKAGLKMPPTQLLIFGNPRTGTAVMLAAPTAAIDLPLKALAWEDGDGKVWLSYNDPQYLKRRFGLTDDDIKGIAGAGSLIEQALK